MKEGISYSSIHNGIMLNSIPSADIALHIAYELNTSIEYLVYGNENYPETKTVTTNPQTKNRNGFYMKKNKTLLTALEKLQPEVRQNIQDLIFTL